MVIGWELAIFDIFIITLSDAAGLISYNISFVYKEYNFPQKKRFCEFAMTL